MVRAKTPLLLRFAAVGGLGIFVNSWVLSFLYGSFGVDLISASMIATECAIIFNFYLNNKYTFDAGEPTRKKLISFNLTCLGGMAVNAAVLSILASAGVYYLAANVVGILAGFLVNYSFSRYFVWKPESLK